MLFEDFIQKIENELEIVVSSTMRQQFFTYKNEIQRVNQFLNLTAIDDDAGIYAKHFWDSLLISPMIERNMRLCDVGSGAGFPGIVLAIARPDLEVICVEPTGKRANFLKDVAKACELENVYVINDRAEHLLEERESFDVVTARAVSHMDMLSELCLPLVKIGGYFMPMKGAKGMEEYRISEKAIKKLGGKLVDVSHEQDELLGSRFNFKIEKFRPTPKKYPRAYAKIKKTPLSGRKL